MNDKVINIIYDAIEEYNETVPTEDQLEKSPDCMLFHPSGQLDSMGYIEMSTAIERQTEEQLGVTISLFAGDPDNPVENPLETIASTADYLARLVENENNET